MAIFSYSSPPPPPPPYTAGYSPNRSRSLTITSQSSRNRSLSVRSRKEGSSSSGGALPKHRFTMASLRGMQQPDLSKKLFKLIKAENHAITAHETAARERAAIATQLSEWGEATEDDAISEISDKLGVLMAEIAEQEELYAQNLEDYRNILKHIRNTESSVQPSRDHKAKVHDEIQKLKYKEPQSTKIVQLEQELVRAEAQSLVAEAQLTNVTRQKLKSAYDVHFAAVIERSEKQILLAKHARRLLNLLDDTPIVPGDNHTPFEGAQAAAKVLSDAEDDLRAWTPASLEQISSQSSNLSAGAMPGSTIANADLYSEPEDMHPAYREKDMRVRSRSASRSLSGSSSRRVASGGSVQSIEGTPYTVPEDRAIEAAV